ncbi:MAG: CinA family protein [Lachnospiraceae bacterium]|nr:CinA family protein [Lachnospiraceae bacterium]
MRFPFIHSAAPEEELVSLLMQKNYRICCAESCTGGLLAASIVNVPNASSVLDVSFVTYANEAKISCLSVDPDTIAEHGVVSSEVAAQMAAGAAARANAQVGVGISGIAGPSGGTKEKPVGMVCFGFWVNGRQKTVTRYFGSIGRNRVRRASVNFAIRFLCRMLSEE